MALNSWFKDFEAWAAIFVSLLYRALALFKSGNLSFLLTLAQSQMLVYSRRFRWALCYKEYHIFLLWSLRGSYCHLRIIIFGLFESGASNKVFSKERGKRVSLKRFFFSLRSLKFFHSMVQEFPEMCQMCFVHISECIHMCVRMYASNELFKRWQMPQRSGWSSSMLL